MSESYAVSVVLSTFNRAAMLQQALTNLLRQEHPHPPYEVIVVDNNSTDDTRCVVEHAAAGAPVRVRYVFEPRQGLSHARNAGIETAHADIVAFTDDDVRVSPRWVQVVHEALASRPDVQCLGGRTLPIWPTAPPSWLTRLHWVGPLALQDYGDKPLVIDAKGPLCLAGANLALRKQVFDKIGRFSVDFPRAQDTELLLRLYRAGFRALYVPDMLIHAEVAPQRLTKAYHRQWHSNIGFCNARMKFEELADPILGLRPQVPRFRRVFGVPAFAIRQFSGEIWKWLRDTALRRDAEAFLHETRARALVSYMREARKLDHTVLNPPNRRPRSERESPCDCPGS